MQLEQNENNKKSIIKKLTNEQKDMEMFQKLIKQTQKKYKQNKQKHKKKLEVQSLSIQINPQQYHNLNTKILGNYSLWNKTTFQTRYNDHRLKFLTPQYFLNKTILNIGCNQGFIDIQIAMRFFPKHILGIDIDLKLIKNARKTLSNIVQKNNNYQQLINAKQNQKQQNQNSRNQLINQVKQTQQYNKICNKIQQLPLFFRERLKHKYSLQSYLPSNVQIKTQKVFKPSYKFPLNISFQSTNILTFKLNDQSNKYDTILCLKLTKWIHLTYGDQGIRLLFKKVYQLLKLDGLFIIQFQDWKSYKKQISQFKLYKNKYNQIKTGPNEFQRILTNDPQKQFKFQLLQKIDNDPINAQNKKTYELSYPIYIFKKQSMILYY